MMFSHLRFLSHLIFFLSCISLLWLSSLSHFSVFFFNCFNILVLLFFVVVFIFFRFLKYPDSFSFCIFVSRSHSHFRFFSELLIILVSVSGCFPFGFDLFFLEALIHSIGFFPVFLFFLNYLMNSFLPFYNFLFPFVLFFSLFFYCFSILFFLFRFTFPKLLSYVCYLSLFLSLFLVFIYFKMFILSLLDFTLFSTSAAIISNLLNYSFELTIFCHGVFHSIILFPLKCLMEFFFWRTTVFPITSSLVFLSFIFRLLYFQALVIFFRLPNNAVIF